MISLLPWPWSWIATAFLDAVSTFIVPKITNLAVQNMVKEVIQFLLSGNITPQLQAAGDAHALASNAQPPDLKKS